MLIVYIVGILGMATAGLLGGSVVTSLVNRSKDASKSTTSTRKSKTRKDGREKVKIKEKKPKKSKVADEKIENDEKNTSKSTSETIEEIVDKKMNSTEVKQIVGKNAEKAKYLKSFLMTVAEKQHKNGKSVEDLMNHKSMNDTIIPAISARIDKFLKVANQTISEFSKFADMKDEKYFREQKIAMNKKLKNLETQMLENSKMFDSSVENYEADLIKVVSDMKKGKHISGLMRDVAELQKGATKSSEQIAIIQEELEKHGYDLEMLGALGLVDMSHDVEKNKQILVDIYNKVQKFEQKLDQHDYDFKELKALNLVNLVNKVKELNEKNTISEEDAKVLFAACLNKYVNSDEFTEKVQDIISKTEITVTEKMTKNARKKVVEELYNTIMSDGELDSKKMKETVDGAVKDAIENRLTVKGKK